MKWRRQRRRNARKTAAISVAPPAPAPAPPSIVSSSISQAVPSSSVPFATDNIAPGAPSLSLSEASRAGVATTAPITKLATPTIDGTAEAGSTVILYGGTTKVGSVVAGSAGVFTITTMNLADGVHKLTATATDQAGNTSAASAVQTITIDSKAPPTPLAPTLAAGFDSGLSSADGITNATAPRLSGTAEAGAQITLFDGTASVATETADATTGSYTIDLVSNLTDGTHAFTVTATDAAGNSSATSTPRQIIIDTKAPATPAAPALAAQSDSGVAASDGITNLQTPTITGVVEPKALVTLYDTNQTTVLGTMIATASGAYSIASTSLADGSHSLRVTATDKAGNVSWSSPSLNIVVDTQAPVAPTFAFSPTSPTGSSSSAMGTGVSITPSTHSLSLVGVNLSGGEYGSASSKYGYGYVYPSTSEIDYYASKGLNVIRLPFQWERLQPTLNGPISASELSRIDAVVDYAASKGMKVILDPHDYGAYNGQLVGSSAVPNSAFANFWGQVASHYANDPNVMFGLMNEPNQQTATSWLASENAAIAAIRGTGATQEILVQGSYWDGASGWTNTDNASIIGTGIRDPINNYAIELHQYLDANQSGTSPNVVSVDIGVQHLQAATQWAEASGTKLFLGEFGVATDATSLQALNNMMSYMSQHNGVWQGATYWAGGPWWGDYMYSIEPSNGVDKPQMAILDQYAPGNQGGVPLPNVSAQTGSAPDTAAIASCNSATLTVIGTAEARSLVALYDGTTMVGGAVANSNGNFTITTAKLADGTHKLTATATDEAGNTSLASAVPTIMIDTQAPETPDTPALLLASDAGLSSSDGITNIAMPTLNGIAEAGSTISLYDGTKVVGSATADSLTGAYTIAPAAALGDGTHLLSITATDAVGNSGAPSEALQVVTDTTTQVAIATAGGVAPAQTQTLAGTGENGATIKVLDNGNDAGTTSVAADGSWTAKVNLAQGSNTLAAQGTERAGNIATSKAVVFQYNPSSLNLMVQAMSTLSPSASSTITPTAASASSTDHMLAAAHC